MTKTLISTFFADGKKEPEPQPAPVQYVDNRVLTPFATGSTSGSSSGSASRPPVQSPPPVMDTSRPPAVQQPSAGTIRQLNLESTFLQGGSQPESQPAEQPAAEQPEAENSGSWSLFGVTMKKLYWILSGVGLVVLLAVVTKYLSR